MIKLLLGDLILIMYMPVCNHKTSWSAKIFLLLNLNMTNKESDEAFDQSFKPKGAVVFFALLIILGMIIWFGIYFLMLSRA